MKRMPGQTSIQRMVTGPQSTRSLQYPVWLYYSTAMALLGSLQFGYHLGVLNTCLDYVTQDIYAQSMGPWIVSSILIGATLGSLLSGSFADAVGPKRATIYNTIPFITGTIMCATSNTLQSMLIGRFLTGIAAGASSLFSPRYISEIAPNDIRGLLGTLHQITINIGIVLAFAVGLPYGNGPSVVVISGQSIGWWRCMFWVAVIPSALQALGMSVCPESPVWLLFSGKKHAASKSYIKLHGNDVCLNALHHRDETDGGGGGATDEEAATIGTVTGVVEPLLPRSASSSHITTTTAAGSSMTTNASISTTHVHTEGFSALLKPRYRRVMILAATLPLLQQLSGINSVVLYGSQVLKQSGVSSPIVANLLLGVDNTISTVIAAGLMDKAGRKKLLTWSYGGMGACLVGMAGFLVLPLPFSYAGPISFISIMTYIFFFALGSGPITWLYLPEILPPEIKGVSQSSVTALNWLSNFLISLYFPTMLDTLGFSGAYAVFGVACLAGAVFCKGYMVETKQRSLENIQAELLVD